MADRKSHLSIQTVPQTHLQCKVFRNISNVLLDLGRIFLTVLVASEMLDIFSREKWSAKYYCSN